MIETKTKPKFKPGDVVVLKSGSDEMTIAPGADKTPGWATCVWWHAGSFDERRLPEVALELASVMKMMIDSVAALRKARTMLRAGARTSGQDMRSLWVKVDGMLDERVGPQVE